MINQFISHSHDYFIFPIGRFAVKLVRLNSDKKKAESAAGKSPITNSVTV